MKVRYFDHAATTQIKKEVLNEMMPFLDEEYGNPSSAHIKGMMAKKGVEEAREKIAKCINAENDEIFFTSGGTESDNLAIKGFARANKKKGNHIITSKIEHKAILESCKTLEDEGFEISYIDVDKYGVIDLKKLEELVKDTTILVSVMFANNEVGTVQPIKEIGEIAHKHNIAFHTDAVQVIGNIPIDVKALNVDMLSMSAHKFYGPKGIGALYVNKDIEFSPIINGGGQEKKKRAGTENVANIVGMGKALEISCANINKYNDKLSILRGIFLDEIMKNIDGVKLNGHPVKRLKGNINLSFNGVDAGSLLLLLSEKGFCVSTASACSTGNKATSHVLKAIGLSEEEARGTLRITFGEENTINDVKALAENIKELVSQLRKM